MIGGRELPDGKLLLDKCDANLASPRIGPPVSSFTRRNTSFAVNVKINLFILNIMLFMSGPVIVQN